MSNTHTPPPAAPAPAHSPLPWRVVEEPDGLWIIDAADRMVCRLFGSITASMAAPRAAATGGAIVAAINAHAAHAAEVARLTAALAEAGVEIERLKEAHAERGRLIHEAREQRDGLLSALSRLLSRPSDDPATALWVDLDYRPTGGDGSGPRDRWFLTPRDLAWRAARAAIAAVNAPATPPVADPSPGWHFDRDGIKRCDECNEEGHSGKDCPCVPDNEADIHGADVRAEVAPSGKAVLP